MIIIPLNTFANTFPNTSPEHSARGEEPNIAHAHIVFYLFACA